MTEDLGLLRYVKVSDGWMLKVVGEALQVREMKNCKKCVDKARKVLTKEGQKITNFSPLAKIERFRRIPKLQTIGCI